MRIASFASFLVRLAKREQHSWEQAIQFSLFSWVSNPCAVFGDFSSFFLAGVLS